MKLAVIGGRDFKDLDKVRFYMHFLDRTREITEFISGGARGADSLGEQVADELGITKQIFKPDWKTHGKKAGILRNTDIIHAADIVLVFWNGKSRGTKDSINKAIRIQKPILVVPYISEQSK